MILLDTNILIEVYRNNLDIIKKIELIGEENIAISAVTAGELLFGARNKKELASIKKDLKQLCILDIDSDVSSLFLALLQQYSLSHGLDIPDALIAATAITNELELYTLNVKDFKFIQGLQLYKF